MKRQKQMDRKTDGQTEIEGQNDRLIERQMDRKTKGWAEIHG